MSLDWHEEGVEEVVVWEIVPWGETDPDAGRIAYNVPLVRPIMGLEVGEEATVDSARGQVTYEVVELLPAPVLPVATAGVEG